MLKYLFLLFFSTTGFASGYSLIYPAVGVGADTYSKGHAYLGISYIDAELSARDFEAYLVSARAEFGLNTTAVSLLAGRSQITSATPSKILFTPTLLVKLTRYEENKTKEEGYSAAVGSSVGILSVFVGGQWGVFEGRDRSGAHVGFELGI